MKKIAVQLVTYNAEKYLPFLLPSLFAVGDLFDLFILDNASQDKTPFLLQEWKEKFSDSVNVILSQSNVGFSGGHNVLYKNTKSMPYEYVMLVNQDMIFENDFMRRLLSDAEESNASVAAWTPRLLRWDFARAQSIGTEESKTEQIDTLGLRVLRSRRVVEIGAGEAWDGEKKYAGLHDSGYAKEVFGVSGALPLFRLSALRRAETPNGDLFDASFFMYKEDVDLAWRLFCLSYTAHFVPLAIAYHDRTAFGGSDMGDMAAAKRKLLQGEMVRKYSYLNHLRVLFSYTSLYGFALDFFPIMWYEMKKAGWLLLYDRKTLFFAWSSMPFCIKKILLCRKHFLAKCSSNIRIWFDS